jgi:putative phosphoesterase
VIVNNDLGLPFRETEIVHAGNRKFLLHHILNVEQPEEGIKRRIKKERPDVVVFGHTHKPMTWRYDGTLYFNPGYAGKQRFSEPRSVAILHCDEKEIRPEMHAL